MNSAEVFAGNALFNQSSVSKLHSMVATVSQAKELEPRFRRSEEAQLFTGGERERKGTGRDALEAAIVQRVGQDK